MKRFGKLIILSFLLFLFLWGIAEYLVGVIDTEYTHKYRQVRNNSSISTLLIGSSLFENSINPHLIQDDSIYDFATSGRWIYWDMKLAEKLFPTMPNLQTVIFPMAYDAMYDSPHYHDLTSDEEYNIFRYSKFMHVYYDKSPQKYTCRSALYMNQMGFRLWKPLRYDELGYRPISGKHSKWEVKPDTVMLRNERQCMCYEEYIKYLREIACVCYKNNIRFIVVTPPCADYYNSNVSDEGIRNLYTIVDSVKTYYPIEYCNYLKDAEFRTDSIYYNADHLNSRGADMFAKRVRDDFNL